MTKEVCCWIPVLPRNVLALLLITIQATIWSTIDVDDKGAWFGFSLFVRLVTWLGMNYGYRVAKNNCEASLYLFIVMLIWLLPIGWMDDNLPKALKSYIIFSFIDTILFYGLIFTIPRGTIYFYRTIKEEEKEGDQDNNEVSDHHVVEITGETENE